LFQDFLLALGERRLRIEIDGDDVGLLAAPVAPGDIELGLALIWRQLEIGLGHTLPGALIERIDEACVDEAALVTDAIAELGRGLRRRHGQRPAGIRAHEAGQRLWRLQCRDLLLLRRQHALAAAFFKLCQASRARRSLWRQIKIADDRVVKNLDMIALRRELAHLALRLLGDLHHRLAGVSISTSRGRLTTELGFAPVSLM